MNATTKILAGFTVGTIAGTLLGMLLISSEDSKSIKITGEGKKGTGSFVDRFFRHKKNNDATKAYKERIKQNAEEYEQE